MPAAKGKAAEEGAPAPSKAEKAAASSQNKEVKVKNVSKRVIQTRKGPIEPGKTGTCLASQARQFRHFLKKA